ncbi:MAG: HAMP domain-containing histidine kinase [Planctomycetes bacterium]|nr:HAMP domain-containing histidine kinase [Planctomycetota bacterium]
MTADTTTRSDDIARQALPAAALHTVLDVMESAVVVADRSGLILLRNAVARDKLCAGDELSTVLAGIKVVGEFPGWANLPQITGMSGRTVSWKALQRGGAHSIEPTAIVVRCAPFRDVGSGVSGVVVQIDETEPDVSEPEATDLSRRLAALGKLAAQVAHELNNPLDGILRYLNLSLRLAADMPESKLKSYLSESRTGVMRMVQVVGELLEFSRSTDGDFDESGINEIVEQAIHSMTEGQKANGIVVTADFQSQSMPRVRGSRLYQVCCNLIKNAIDAMPHGGRLTLTTGLVDEEVVIRFADTGVGLPPEPERMFEAFYTTKPSGAGTGLGLAICKDFIEHMGGTIAAVPGQGGGAVIIVRIPTSACGRT